MNSIVGSLILRGLVAGVVAGLLAFGWARMAGEPAVNTAISFESAEHDAAVAAAVAAGQQPPAEEPVIFTRAVQSGIGLLTGIVVIGAAFGGLFALLFAYAYGRIAKLAARPTAVLLALFGWLSIYVIPALKYPPNPPAVGEPDTIKYRTALYFIMLAISLAAAIGAMSLRSHLARRFGNWSGSLYALASYVVVIALCYLFLPVIDEIPSGFPADTLWHFRMASLGIQTILWAGIGLMFGYLAEGVLAKHPAQAPALN